VIGVMDGVAVGPTCIRRRALPSRSRSSLASSLTWRRYQAALSGWPSVQPCSAILQTGRAARVQHCDGCPACRRRGAVHPV